MEKPHPQKSFEISWEVDSVPPLAPKKNIGIWSFCLGCVISLILGYVIGYILYYLPVA